MNNIIAQQISAVFRATESLEWVVSREGSQFHVVRFSQSGEYLGEYYDLFTDHLTAKRPTSKQIEAAQNALKASDEYREVTA